MLRETTDPIQLIFKWINQPSLKFIIINTLDTEKKWKFLILSYANSFMTKSNRTEQPLPLCAHDQFLFYKLTEWIDEPEEGLLERADCFFSHRQANTSTEMRNVSKIWMLEF